MASTREFVDYICDQLDGAGDIFARKMFGEYAVYCNGKVIGLICDDQLFVKITEVGKTLIDAPLTAPPYEGAKPYFLIDNIDDRSFLIELIRETCKELPPPKKK